MFFAIKYYYQVSDVVKFSMVDRVHQLSLTANLGAGARQSFLLNYFIGWTVDLW
jgi:hypothetical protein